MTENGAETNGPAMAETNGETTQALVPTDATKNDAAVALLNYQEEVVAYLGTFQQSALEIGEIAKAQPVTDQASYERAAEILAQLKGVAKGAELVRVRTVAPFTVVTRAINEAANSRVRDALAPAEKNLKGKMAVYLDAEAKRAAEERRKEQEELERQQRAEQEAIEKEAQAEAERLEAEGKTEEAERVIENMPTAAVIHAAEEKVEKGEGVSTTKVLKFEVLNPALLEHGYLLADEKRIRKVVSALEDRAVAEVSKDPNKPAIKVWRETQISSKAAV